MLVFAPIDQGLARDFKISHQWPAETDACDRAARIFAREVEKRISSVSIQVYPQLSLKMKAEEQFKALQAGTLEMSVYLLPYAAKKVPEFSTSRLVLGGEDAARGCRDDIG